MALASGVLGFMLNNTTVMYQREKLHNIELSGIITEQSAMIERLGALDGVQATVNFNISNKAILGNIKTGDVQPMIENSMRYLRSELVRNDTLVISKNLLR